MDPHNNGTYQLTHEAVSGSGYEVLEGQRRTGDGRYPDKFRLTFEPVGCEVLDATCVHRWRAEPPLSRCTVSINGPATEYGCGL